MERAIVYGDITEDILQCHGHCHTKLASIIKKFFSMQGNMHEISLFIGISPGGLPAGSNFNQISKVRI